MDRQDSWLEDLPDALTQAPFHLKCLFALHDRNHGSSPMIQRAGELLDELLARIHALAEALTFHTGELEIEYVRSKPASLVTGKFPAREPDADGTHSDGLSHELNHSRLPHAMIHLLSSMRRFIDILDETDEYSSSGFTGLAHVLLKVTEDSHRDLVEILEARYGDIWIEHDEGFTNIRVHLEPQLEQNRNSMAEMLT